MVRLFMELVSRKRWTIFSTQVISCCVYGIPEFLTQHMQVVHLLLLKSSMTCLTDAIPILQFGTFAYKGPIDQMDIKQISTKPNAPSYASLLQLHFDSLKGGKERKWSQQWQQLTSFYKQQWQLLLFLKKWPIPASFCLFPLFSDYNFNKVKKA